MKIYLPQDILDIADAYFKANKELYVVGGFVRDFIKYGNSENSHDIDLVTNSLPYESKEILKNFKVSDEQGSNFAVIRVYTNNFPEGIEIASFRKDIVKNGRDTKGADQKVEIGKHITIEDDVKRRDLKCNGLFYNIKTHEIVDLVGGIEDIKNNVYGAIGRASDRFEEDELRKMRLIRFASRSYGKIDKETSEALKQNNSLKTVSQERIIEEIYKMFDYSKKKLNFSLFRNYLELLFKYDFMQYVFKDIDVHKKTIYSSNLTVILSNILKRNVSNTLLNKLIYDVKLNTEISNEIVFLLKLQELNFNNFFELKKLENKIKIDKNIIYEFFNKTDQYKKIISKFIKFEFTVKGDDLINAGFVGKEIGEEMKRLETDKFIKFMYE